jgi:hypothetical protein
MPFKPFMVEFRDRTFMRFMSALLIVEALWTVLRIASLLPTMAAYDPIAVALIAARALVGAVQLFSGWSLPSRRPQAAALATAALLASALLHTLEAGAQLAPSVIFHFWRWQILAAYWLYASTAAWYLLKK